MADGKWTMRPFFKGLVIVALAALALPGLLFAFLMLLRLYAIELAPVSMRSRVISPDGRFKTGVGSRGWMDESYDRTLFLQEGDHRPRRVWTNMPFLDRPEWSPDSRLVALANTYAGRHIREFSEGRPRREVPCAKYEFAVYDVRTGRHAVIRGEADLDIPAEVPYPTIKSEWHSPDSILISVQYRVDDDNEVFKPVALITVRATSSALQMSERPIMKPKGRAPKDARMP
jgi:hypothetical protein